jgi:hypothetical protein
VELSDDPCWRKIRCVAKAHLAVTFDPSEQSPDLAKQSGRIDEVSFYRLAAMQRKRRPTSG